MTAYELPVNLAKYVSMDDDHQWLELNTSIGNQVNWPPLAIKAFYVFGVIHDICESVDWLLKFPDPQAPRPWPVTYFPAFGVCASAIELLGRCLNGDDKVSGTNRSNLQRGFNWLIESAPKNATRPGVVTVTNYAEYEVENLLNLRHFTAHGQAITGKSRSDPQKYAFRSIDIELLDAFPQLIGNAMERYWGALRNSEQYCEDLAKAKIIPLRGDPIKKMLEFYNKGMSAGDPFLQFDWQVYK